MSEQKYTAKDFRHAVFARQARMNAVPLEHPTEDELDEMLEQAADDADELAKLNARLAAVVKECKRINDETFERSINKVVAYKTRVDVASDAICHAILRAARGEGGA